MLKQSPFSRSSCTSFNSRVFVYEVSGLADSDQTQDQSYPIRQSSSVYYQVPFGQMNQAMQRFTRLGAKIVSIQPLEDFSPPAENKAPSSNESEDD